MNGDGYGDVIVGADGAFSNTGAAYVYLGSPNGLSSTAATTLNGTAFSYFGFSVASAGDVNGDGYSDVVVGAFEASPDGRTNAGTAYIYLGSSGGLSATPATTLNGIAADDHFGYSVASAGDVNGDGYSDVIVGVYAALTINGGAYVYLGSSTGLSATAATTLSGTAYSYFGFSVASAGDVNGDSYSDLIIGADGVSSYTGAAYLYAGNGGYGKRNDFLRLYEADLSTPIKQTNRSASQFGAGLFVRPFPGAAKARLVWETEVQGTGFMHNSPITNYAGYTAGQTSYTAIPPAGVELKNLITKTGAATKVRMRVQYMSTLLPNGQKFGPWVYPQAYLTGAMGSGVEYGLVGQPLPLTLLGFTGQLQSGDRALLKWQTADEQNTSRFELERSSDAIAFNALGEVAAKGNGGNNYQYTDTKPLPVNYYRLNMVDIDGRYTYSNTALVVAEASAGHSKVYPNPGPVTLIVGDNGLLHTKALLTDAMGKTIQIITITDPVQAIQLNGIASGMYLLKLEDGELFGIIKH